jgi:hypothetical protein
MACAVFGDSHWPFFHEKERFDSAIGMSRDALSVLDVPSEEDLAREKNESEQNKKINRK